MSLIELIQGSEAWHEFRRSHIGSSDAPVVMGVSPYKTAAKLLEEKITGKSFQKEHAGMRRGKELEPEVLALVNNRFSLALEPAVFEHDEHKFMSASLDGYDPVSRAICEIKCPNGFDHAQAETSQVPAKYYPQLQHAMFVMGLSEIIYASYYKGELVTLIVAANKQYQSDLLDECIKFHEMMKSKTFHDFECEDRPDIDFLYLDYADLKSKIRFYEEELEKVKFKLIEACSYSAVETKRVKIKEVTRISYDYPRLCADHFIDIEPYKKTSKYWDIREKKNEN
jgi:putative phage-type endonuclease